MDPLAQALLALLGVLATALLAWIGNNLSDLNKKMIIIVETVGRHDGRLSSLENSRRRR